MHAICARQLRGEPSYTSERPSTQPTACSLAADGRAPPPARSARWSCPTPVQRTGRMPTTYSADGSRSPLQSVVRAYPLASCRRGAVRNPCSRTSVHHLLAVWAPWFSEARRIGLSSCCCLRHPHPSSYLLLTHTIASLILSLLRRSKAGVRICLCAAACGGPSHCTLIKLSHH